MVKSSKQLWSLKEQQHTTTSVLRPLHRSTCVSLHLQFRNGGFCWCKVLLSACPCWWQPAHSDQGENAGFLVHSAIYTVTVPSSLKEHFHNKNSRLLQHVNIRMGTVLELLSTVLKYVIVHLPPVRPQLDHPRCLPLYPTVSFPRSSGPAVHNRHKRRVQDKRGCTLPKIVQTGFGVLKTWQLSSIAFVSPIASEATSEIVTHTTSAKHYGYMIMNLYVGLVAVNFEVLERLLEVHKASTYRVVVGARVPCVSVFWDSLFHLLSPFLVGIDPLVHLQFPFRSSLGSFPVWSEGGSCLRGRRAIVL